MRTSLLFLVGLACKPAAPPPAAPADAPVLRAPPLHDRDYRLVSLDNGMVALLVSDPDTDMAAAALDVHVGQFQDPPDREGLAHFLEHMLFMGTQAYPDVEDYRRFIQDHGGGTNAGTSQEHTNYFFKVDSEHLEGALDRFSWFFRAPLLDPAYVDRERNAVNSEYRLKLQEEARRLREVRRKTSNPAHGFAKFSVGNLETLADREGDPVYEDVRAFYQAEYSADRMRLSVLGTQDLDTLEAWVRSRFTEVPNQNLGPPVSAMPPHLPEQQGVRIHVTPLTELRELILEFTLPPPTPFYDLHPLDLLTRLVGQEGPGSLHAALSKRGWITRLSATEDGAEDHGMLQITLNLTDQGWEHREEVVSLCFQFLRLLREAPTLQPWYDEMRQLTELSFRFSEPAPPDAAVRQHVSALQAYPPEHALDFWATFQPYQPEVQRRWLDPLTPENLRLFVIGPGLATDQVEPRYSVPYAVVPIPPDERTQLATARVAPDLTLPPQNPFIPQDLTLVAEAEGGLKAPRQLLDDPSLSLWHLADPSFQVPRSSLSLSWVTPQARSSLEDRVMSVLWTRLVADAQAPLRDQLAQAGLSARLSSDAEGFQLVVEGYDDRLDDAARRVLTDLLRQELDPVRFQALREQLQRDWSNTAKDRAIDQAGRGLEELLNPAAIPPQAGLQVLEDLTLAALQDRVKVWQSEATLEALIHGNTTAADAERLLRDLDGLFPGAAPARPPVTLRQTAEPLAVDWSIEHGDSAMIQLYPAPDTTLDAAAHTTLLAALLRTPYFGQLRTEEQLGYVVYATFDRRDHLTGVRFGIQSGVADPRHLAERTRAFLSAYFQKLKEMPEEDFNAIRDGQVAILREAPTDLFDLSGDLRADLALGVRTFDRKEQLAQRVATLTRDELLPVYEAILLQNPRVLTLSAWGKAHPRPDDAACDLACAAPKLAPYLRPR